MAVTVLYETREAHVASDAREDGDRLWLSAPDLAEATGWTLKPEGLCKGEACVPLPRDGSWSDAAGRVDLAAFARGFHRPVVRDEQHAIWAVGESAGARSQQLSSLEAPDFTLPDLDGKLHSLADYRGRKIFLLSWGSY